jgi:hypothetical protein
MPMPMASLSRGSVPNANSDQLPEAWGAFLHQFAWDHVATLTFRHSPSVDAAIREFLNWIRRLSKRTQGAIPWFSALERGRSGWLHHHVLTAGTASLTVETMRETWWTWGGISKIEVFDPARGAAWYVSKGVPERCAWYDVTRRRPPLRPCCGLTCEVRTAITHSGYPGEHSAISFGGRCSRLRVHSAPTRGPIAHASLSHAEPSLGQSPVPHLPMDFDKMLAVG